MCKSTPQNIQIKSCVDTKLRLFKLNTAFGLSDYLIFINCCLVNLVDLKKNDCYVCYGRLLSSFLNCTV